MRESFQLILPAFVLQVCVVDDEVRGEHAGCDFVTVGAVADECRDKAGAFRWLESVRDV